MCSCIFNGSFSRVTLVGKSIEIIDSQYIFFSLDSRYIKMQNITLSLNISFTPKTMYNFIFLILMQT